MKTCIFLFSIILFYNNEVQSKQKKIFVNYKLQECDSSLAKHFLLIEDIKPGKKGKIKVDKYNMKGQLLTSSEYSNFKKKVLDGSVKEFFPTGNLSTLKLYKKNKLQGNTFYYYQSGELRRQEVYDKDNFVLGKCFTKTGNDTVYYPKEKYPEFTGGMEMFIFFLNSNVKYPLEAQKNKIQGTVLVSFRVEKNGYLSNIKIKQSVHPLLDKEALRVVNLMHEAWHPGYVEGNISAMNMVIPIRFKL